MVSKQLVSVCVIFIIYCLSFLDAVTDANSLNCMKSHCIKTCQGNIDKTAAQSCEKGCSYFTILSVTHGQSDNAVIQKECAVSCGDAYGKTPQEQECQKGCKLFTESHADCNNRHATLEDAKQPMSGIFTPFMVIKKVYSSVVHHVRSTLVYTFSFYKNDATKEVIVLSEGPNVIQSLENGPMEHIALQKSVSSKSALWWRCVFKSTFRHFLIFAVAFSSIIAIWFMCSHNSKKSQRVALAIKNEAKKPLLADDPGPLPEKLLINDV